MVALFENPGTIEEIAKFFKKKRANSADLEIYNIEVSDLRVVVPNKDPGYEIQREEFISRKIGLV